MKTDVQIAQEAKMLYIDKIAEQLGIEKEDLFQYGHYMAKIEPVVYERLKDKKDGKLVLVTAISPTPAGEGKTTVNIGLSMGLNKIGKKAISALREPSLGPSFGVKGGAAGGGYAQVVPMTNINLHFTGDFHAITAANNLIAAMLDNHIHQGNVLPNLVQTLENTPAILHGGPFANIAHGCNSILATKYALKLADYTVTEAGFGADLGAEKFFDIKCRMGDLHPNAVVIVATIRALKHHGGVTKEDYDKENLDALRNGFENLKKHMENVAKFGVPSVVAINQFPTDTEAEIELLKELVEKEGRKCVLSQVFAKGGEGAVDLAKEVVRVCEEEESHFKPLYDVNDTIENKITTIAKEIYGAKDVIFTKEAKKSIKRIVENGMDKVPVCMAKTQYSLSDDPKLLGAPKDFELTVRNVRISNGAGFVVALTGDIMTMPGLPKVPAANNIDIKEDGEIVGLF